MVKDINSFLKPSQLWERCEAVNSFLDDSGPIGPGEQEWDGYWWRLVENHEKENR